MATASSDYTGPRIGELAIVQGPIVRVVELAGRDGVAGAVVTVEGVTAWVPIEWLIRVPLNGSDQ